MAQILKNALCEQLKIAWPLIQAPLGGGPTTPELVAAVANAGALGFLGAAYLSPEILEQNIKKILKLTNHPFGVNLFAPAPVPKLHQEQIDRAMQATQNYRAELSLSAPKIQPPFVESFSEQMNVVLKYKPAVFSYTFGLIEKELIHECQRNHIFVIGTATTLEEALILQDNGVDAVVAQGAEAGGHRGTFYPDQIDPLLGTLVLTQLLIRNLHIPVIASGGIMDGKGIAAALMSGAQAVQLGTAFLLCDEAGTSIPYRQALAQAKGNLTQLTKAFSGRWARGIKNRFMLEMAQREEAILPYPAQNAFTRDIRKKAAETNQAEFLSLWAGQGVDLIRKMKAGDLVRVLYEETKAALE